MTPSTNMVPPPGDLPPGSANARFVFFGELVKRPVRVRNGGDRLGKLSDVVVLLKEPYPDVVGLFLDHGWGKPTEFIPWERVISLEGRAIEVQPPDGDRYPPFTDQPGWLRLGEDLLGRTILDMDGRRTEVVNDVHLLMASGRALVVHVDISMNGFLRRLGLSRLNWIKENLISWRYVQPFSVEDAVKTDKVSLSVARRQLPELPAEDLADVLEELKGQEQQALFSALDAEKAAETLMEAEPRAQRQLIANLRQERAKQILTEMSPSQLANLASILPHDDATELLGLMPADDAARVRTILSEQEAKAGSLIDAEFLQFDRKTTVGEALRVIRASGRDRKAVSYLYVVGPNGKTLVGVVDVRELLLAPDQEALETIMVAPVVSADEDDLREDLEQIFSKYQYRMIPVVNAQDHLLGVVRLKDVLKGGGGKSKD